MVDAVVKGDVQRTWELVIPPGSGDDHVFAIGKLFFDRIFEVTPGAEALFSFKGEDRAESAKFRAHAIKVIKTVGVAVAKLDDLETLVPILEDLGKKHVAYGVVAEHYDLIGSALLWTLKTGLGDEFTPNVEKAWTAVYGVVANTMKAGAGYDKPAALKVSSSSSSGGSSSSSGRSGSRQPLRRGLIKLGAMAAAVLFARALVK